MTKLAGRRRRAGQGLLACQKTLKGSDKAAFVAACFAADDPDIVGKNLDYFETVPALAESSCRTAAAGCSSRA